MREFGLFCVRKLLKLFISINAPQKVQIRPKSEMLGEFKSHAESRVTEPLGTEPESNFRV